MLPYLVKRNLSKVLLKINSIQFNLLDHTTIKIYLNLASHPIVGNFQLVIILVHCFWNPPHQFTQAPFIVCQCSSVTYHSNLTGLILMINRVVHAPRDMYFFIWTFCIIYIFDLLKTIIISFEKISKLIIIISTLNFDNC